MIANAHTKPRTTRQVTREWLAGLGPRRRKTFIEALALEIDDVIQGGVATTSPQDVILAQWVGNDIEFRHSDFGYEIKHTSVTDEFDAWISVDRIKGYQGLGLHHFPRLIHERMAFDAGRMPIAPPRFVALELELAYAAKFGQKVSA